MLTRFRCYLFGCTCGDYCECHRCNLCIYDFGYRQQPCWLVQKWQWLAWKCGAAASVVIGKKCEACGKRFWKRWRNVRDYTCSRECEDKWIPF